MIIKSFNTEYLKYLFPQRTRLMTEYALSKESDPTLVASQINTMVEKDFVQIENHLPANAANVLDIGCGLGLIDIAIHKHYSSEPVMHLLDKTQDLAEGESIRGFNKEYTFYNSLDGSKETLISNDVAEDKIKTYEVGQHQALNEIKFDLIISLLSCGWHYSLETYVDLIKNQLTHNGILILDIRHNTGQLEYAQEHFNLIQTIENTNESKHTGGTVGDRYVFSKK
jgi:SAM-dependent methyltransferase